MMIDRTDLGLKDTTPVGCACCAPAAATASEIPVAMVTTELLVSGMTCAHCVSSVTEELTAIDGVQNVTVDLHPGGASCVTMHSSTPVSASAVEAAVEEAGYTLVDSPV